MGTACNVELALGYFKGPESWAITLEPCPWLSLLGGGAHCIRQGLDFICSPASLMGKTGVSDIYGINEARFDICSHYSANFSYLVLKVNHSLLSLRWKSRCLLRHTLLTPLPPRTLLKYSSTSCYCFATRICCRTFYITTWAPHRELPSFVGMAETRLKGGNLKSQVNIHAAEGPFNLKVTMHPLLAQEPFLRLASASDFSYFRHTASIPLDKSRIVGIFHNFLGKLWP